jgi:MAF protein
MIVLGSTSPRRNELLKRIVSDFKIVAPLFDERTLVCDNNHYALEEAKHKALSIIDKIDKDDCLITVDTIVYFNNKIYGKPSDKNDAFKMLKELANHTHEVISGYTIIYKNSIITNEVFTKVTFNSFTDKEIQHYIDSINVFDKAGSYSFQDDDNFHLIKKVEGSTTNVMGFPLDEIEKELKKLKLI